MLRSRLLADRVGLETEQVKQQAGELFEDTQGNPYFLEQLIEGFDQTLENSHRYRFTRSSTAN